jgi:DNA-binding PadR family transcriptional regulator
MARFPPNEALENNRRAKYYSITAKGKKTVAAGTQTWDRLSVAVQRVLAR